MPVSSGGAGVARFPVHASALSSVSTTVRAGRRLTLDASVAVGVEP